MIFYKHAWSNKPYVTGSQGLVWKLVFSVPTTDHGNISTRWVKDQKRDNQKIELALLDYGWFLFCSRQKYNWHAIKTTIIIPVHQWHQPAIILLPNARQFVASLTRWRVYLRQKRHVIFQQILRYWERTIQSQRCLADRLPSIVQLWENQFRLASLQIYSGIWWKGGGEGKEFTLVHYDKFSYNVESHLLFRTCRISALLRHTRIQQADFPEVEQCPEIMADCLGVCKFVSHRHHQSL